MPGGRSPVRSAAPCLANILGHRPSAPQASPPLKPATQRKPNHISAATTQPTAETGLCAQPPGPQPRSRTNPRTPKWPQWGFWI